MADPFSVMTSFNWAIISSSMLCVYAGYTEKAHESAIDELKRDYRYCRERYDFLTSIGYPQGKLAELVYLAKEYQIPEKPKSALPITLGFFIVIFIIAVSQLGAVVMFWWAGREDFAFDHYKYPSIAIAGLMVLFIVIFAFRIWAISISYRSIIKKSNEINRVLKQVSTERFESNR